MQIEINNSEINVYIYVTEGMNSRIAIGDEKNENSN